MKSEHIFQVRENSVLRYWRTVRHLKAIQILGRARRCLPPDKLDENPPPSRREFYGQWCKPAAREASMEGPCTFRFLNRRKSVEHAADWNAECYGKLWLYNLHYFDDLNATNSSSRNTWHRSLLARWISENPPAYGNGWEPYPLSLRIVNWLKWAFAGNNLDQQAMHSLAMQTRYLSRHLEWHLLGNHLFANAKALVFAGCYFDGNEAQSWIKAGLRILEKQIPEQILSDGGHFERSPMYHSIIQEDLLDLINIARAYPHVIAQQTSDAWAQIVNRMRAWLITMIHPDGKISFFNDSAHGVAASPSELEAYAHRLDLGTSPVNSDVITHLEPSGYVRVQNADYVALLDVGPIGPDYIPGHAHADTLSFELSLAGRRLFVNSGTSCYDVGPERLYQRSTAAHNTVVVDGENSSEVWSSFRVARRAYPTSLSVAKTLGEICIRCCHDGYQRLPGKVTHCREWKFTERSFQIDDRLSGQFGNAVSYLHLHPDVAIKDNGHIECSRGARVACSVSGGIPVLKRDTYHPEFNYSLSNQCLTIFMNKPQCSVNFSIN